MAVTYRHTNGQVVRVSKESRAARLMAAAADWSEVKAPTKEADSGSGNTRRRRSTARPSADASGADAG